MHESGILLITKFKFLFTDTQQDGELEHLD